MKKNIIDTNIKYNIKEFYIQTDIVSNPAWCDWTPTPITYFEDKDENMIYLFKENDDIKQRRIKAVIDRAKNYLETNAYPNEKQDIQSMIAIAHQIRFELVPPDGEVVKKFSSRAEYNRFLKEFEREVWIDHVNRLNGDMPLKADVDPEREKFWNEIHKRYKRYLESRCEDFARRRIGSSWHHLGLYDAYGKPLDDKLYIRTNFSDGAFGPNPKRPSFYETCGFTYHHDEYLSKWFGEERGYWEKHNVDPGEADEVIKTALKYTDAEILAEFFTCSEKLAKNQSFQRKHMMIPEGKNERRIGWNKQNFRCAYCGKRFNAPKYVTIDYVDRAKGDSDFDNLIYSCNTCNRKKSNSNSSKWDKKARLSKENWFWPVHDVIKAVKPVLILVVAYLLICAVV